MTSDGYFDRTALAFGQMLLVEGKYVATTVRLPKYSSDERSLS